MAQRSTAEKKSQVDPPPPNCLLEPFNYGTDNTASNNGQQNYMGKLKQVTYYDISQFPETLQSSNANVACVCERKYLQDDEEFISRLSLHYNLLSIFKLDGLQGISDCQTLPFVKRL